MRCGPALSSIPFMVGKFPLTIVLDEQIPAGTPATDLPPNYEQHVISKMTVPPPEPPPPAAPDSSAAQTETTASTEDTAPPGPLTPSIQVYPAPTPAPSPAPRRPRQPRRQAGFISAHAKELRAGCSVGG